MSLNSASGACDSPHCGCGSSLTRRDFLRWSSLITAAALPSWRTIAGPFQEADFKALVPADKKLDPAWVKSLAERGEPTVYRGAELEKIGMPVGGICAGQLYLGGDGRLWHWDIFNLPQAPRFSDTNGPNYASPPKPSSPLEQGFAIRVHAQGTQFVRTLDSRGIDPSHIRFRGQYPIGSVEYDDPGLPVRISLEAFSPFIPLHVVDSALPATVMHFAVRNTSTVPVDVELAGWLQNAVCFGAPATGHGQRRNRILREPGLTGVHSTAERVAPARTSVSRPEIIFETFENGYTGWKVEGDAFGPEPAAGTLPNQNRVSGFLGQRLVNTFFKGDSSRGRLTSREFKVERKFIGFLIGGGSHSTRTCLNLLVDGQVVRTASGHNEERLEWQEWDVSALENRTAHLEIVDQATEGWGHINVDQIVFTDEPPSARTPLESREDFGSMTLAVLGDDSGTFATARAAGDLPGATFISDLRESQPEATASMDSPLVGAVGRKLSLAPGAHGEVTFLLSWFFPGLHRSALGPLQDLEKLRRSYANRFASAADVSRYIARNFGELAGQTRLWNKTWYDSTLPFWFLDRTFASICTLATNTCYQFQNGRFYAFEGVYCCQGTCQHVWNYAQAVARIFPELERDLRARTDFGSAWHDNGAIDYRGECARHVAHDGQCGVVLRALREHQMCVDDAYLRTAWPHIRKSVEYLIRLDGGEDGLLEGEQFNTLDAAWYGPMAWISSLYVAALRAGEAMAREMGDLEFAERCRRIAERGSEQLVAQLYNGEYFIHKPDPSRPKATNTNDGCHIDQVMGQAWALQIGLPRVIALEQTHSALRAIWTHNFTPDIKPYRDKSLIRGGRWYALAGEGGVIMTTFPRGGMERASGHGGFGYYFNEVWTGQEHQLAAHMLWEGMMDEALVVTRVVHDRHHALKRNPYNEVECSDHYTRAMSSYGTFLAACGFEHHGPKGHLGFAPRLTPENFQAPFTTAQGWGTFAQTRASGEQVHKITMHYGSLSLRTFSFAVSETQTVQSVRAQVGGSEHRTTFQQTGSRVLVTFAERINLGRGQTLEIVLS